MHDSIARPRIYCQRFREYTLRMALKDYVDDHISIGNSAVVDLQRTLDEFLETIAINAEAHLKKENEHRKKEGIRPRLRLEGVDIQVALLVINSRRGPDDS